MANTKNFGRQNVKTAVQKLDFQDLPTGATATIKVALPSGAVILPGSGIQVLTAFNSTTNVLDVGDTGSGTRFATDIDLKTTGFKPLTTFGTPGTGLKEVVFRHDSTGIAATAGVLLAIVSYIEPTRADEVME